MAGADDAAAQKEQELATIIREIKERVRARYPDGTTAYGGVSVPDLTGLLHARDAAEGKVASIGTVNPRAPGVFNSAIQGVKRLIARALDWHVREQVEFNRAVMACVHATLEAQTEANRALVRLSALCGEAADIRSHWLQWHREWEEKLAANEIRFLRSVAELQTAYQHRATLMEGNFRDLLRAQHQEFTASLEKATIDIQKHLWADVERMRGEYESLIHRELRVLRQRAAAVSSEAPPQPSTLPAAGATAAPPVDWLKFADRFRGSEEYVARNQQFYVEKLRGCRELLDIGCGRGEFLEVMRQAGIAARGLELNAELVRLCRQKQLDVEEGDLFEYLTSLPHHSLGGVFCAQVVEHLPPERVPEMIRLAGERLERGAPIAIETPNPECLAIFATHFYLDPTHTRPIPPALMVFYLEEAGFGQIELHRLSPAIETMPAVGSLPEEFRSAFFDGLDYAVLARKL